ncbi:acylneuraminate cytidylyltransferase family protein [Candidatus Galacturonibacter soehngenii]|uniref:Acylneuraminate cytidylyltransferase family protein n=1 Tax=Candidatus Galacturonatibacter soehngenii TaxID=2307010 RepID=A0A7V7QK72_9FIRM|nr:acylneuraminate cytidylyltransferase family protein [Candidatus Galacturonibacter soehngenii]KAB1437776.1 acylneuraminate cytidylyltransferase family protein [Candidatus Galacturonibacter soehngenii]
MNFLAIIPARSGSKGIPDKNIKQINNKPLIAYTIEACKKSQIFDEIIVSTDSASYAEIAIQYGASVPFLRSLELASDTAFSNEVILEVLNQYHNQGKDFTYFMLLQPTSPLRKVRHIIESAQIVVEKKADALVSVCKVEHPSFLHVSLDAKGRIQTDCLHKRKRRQDSVMQYRINGAIYIATTEFFMKAKDFYGENTYAYLMKEEESIDIDNEFQFELATWLMSRSE